MSQSLDGSQERSREGESMDMYKALLPIAELKGPRFILYQDKKPLVANAKLHHGRYGVDGHHDVVSALYPLSSGLKFLLLKIGRSA